MNNRSTLSSWLPALEQRWVLLAGVLSVAGYLIASRLVGGLGFPLDDAWIHQTYARNLALHGEWGFWPGQPSAGSTAPFWSALLAVGYRFGGAPLWWTYFVGTACLIGVAWAGMRLVRLWSPLTGRVTLAAGLFLVLEWHLVWAAASGMETLLMALLILLAFIELAQGIPQPFKLGLLLGAGIWVRPDGLTLLGPALLVLALAEMTLLQKGRALFRMAVGVILLGLPYLLFNQMLAGSWWPNTFFAKQAEYASLRELPLIARLVSLYSLPLIGPGVILLAGWPILIRRAWRRRDVAVAAALIWAVGYIALYALRLPVTYQHGRYLIPVMPVVFCAGWAGLAGWLDLDSIHALRRVASRVLAVSLALVTAAFWVIGARAYAYDVALIETEMVQAARWVAENTPPEALVAAHDIGALGFYGNHRILDLAGLVTPEVIPFIRDEARLAAFLDARGADYLMTFPDWYPDLVQGGQEVYDTGGQISPELGGTNMKVYLWKTR